MKLLTAPFFLTLAVIALTTPASKAETLCEMTKALYPEFSKDVPCPQDIDMKYEMEYLTKVRNNFMSPSSVREIYAGQFERIKSTPKKGDEKRAFDALNASCGENSKLIYGFINRGFERSTKDSLKVNFSRSNQFFTGGMLKYIYPAKGSTVTKKCKDDVFKYIDIRAINFLNNKEETSPQDANFIQTSGPARRGS